MPHPSDVGSGGRSFHFHQYMKLDSHVSVRILNLTPEFDTEAKVAWCRKQSNCNELNS